MVQRVRAKRLRVEEDEEEDMAVFLGISSSSSGDDEEANRDLSLEIVERARRRLQELSNTGTRVSQASSSRATSVDDQSSSDELDAISERRKGAWETPPSGGWYKAASVVEGSRKKKNKRKKKQKEVGEQEGTVRGLTETGETAAPVDDAEEVIETTDSVVTVVNDDTFDNLIFRKLLRGPRYFDPGSSRFESCYNCGNEGHMAVDCTAEKRKKPCFVCGMFGHNASKCSQGQDCFTCKRRGHLAKDCPNKRRNTSWDSKICLRCGDFGHVMSACRNDYPPDDLKKIQCYVCKSFGHFCCVNFVDTTPREVSCYNCGVSGHSGVGCDKPRGQPSIAVSLTSCYACGEEGHFAWGCPKRSKLNRRLSGLSTPIRPFKKKTEFFGSKAQSPNVGKAYKKKSMQSEGTRSMTARQSQTKRGWIVDDPGDLPIRIREGKSSRSPRTPRAPVETSYRHYRSAGSSQNYIVY